MAGRLDIRSKRAPFAMAFGPQITAPELSDGAKVTWLLLDVLAGRNGCLWYTVERLARLRGLRERALQAHLAELRQKGWIEVEYRPRKTNVVTVKPPEDIFGLPALQSFYEEASQCMGAGKDTPMVQENAPLGCGKMHPEGDEGKESKEGGSSSFPLSQESPESAFLALVERAKALGVPNRRATIERYIRAWTGRHGQAKVAAVFQGDGVRGLSLVEIEDLHFRANGKALPRMPVPPAQDPAEAQRAREERERRELSRAEACRRRGLCDPAEIALWREAGGLEAREKGVSVGHLSDLYVDSYILGQVARKFGLGEF